MNIVQRCDFGHRHSPYGVWSYLHAHTSSRIAHILISQLSPTVLPYHTTYSIYHFIVYVHTIITRAESQAKLSISLWQISATMPSLDVLCLCRRLHRVPPRARSGITYHTPGLSHTTYPLYPGERTCRSKNWLRHISNRCIMYHVCVRCAIRR